MWLVRGFVKVRCISEHVTEGIEKRWKRSETENKKIAKGIKVRGLRHKHLP
jgi:aspartate aminotransferase-like enzyme